MGCRRCAAAVVSAQRTSSIATSRDAPVTRVGEHAIVRAMLPAGSRTPVMSAEMKKVLIIEDYYALADIESLLCTMEGYEVKVAKSGDEGLTLFEEFEPDLVLLDLMLPGELSGTQVLERIRKDHGGDAKVLVVSALVNSTTAPKLEAFGNVETLGKPFKIKELASRIQS